MQPFDLDNLVGDVYYEIFRHVGAYTLNNVSLTSKHIRLNALTERLWKTHLEREFPHSIEKGSSFEQYSKCKQRVLSPIKGYLSRKCALLVEAGHLNEIKETWPKITIPVAEFLFEELDGKFLPLIMKEQDDQAMIDYFYYELLAEVNKVSNQWTIVFGKVNHLVANLRANYILHAVIGGSAESLECIFQRHPNIDINYAFKNDGYLGSEKIIRWFFDHGVQFSAEDFKYAAQYGTKDFVQFYLEKMNPSTSLIRDAIEDAIMMGRPGILEMLLRHYSKDKSSLNDVLGSLKFNTYPYETAVFLKILLDKGADADYPKMGPEKNFTPLFLACCHPKNEIAIEMLLEKGANPNFTPDSVNSTPLLEALNKCNSSVIKMLLDHDALVTDDILKRAETHLKMKQNYPDSSELSKIVDLLKLKKDRQ